MRKVTMDKTHEEKERGLCWSYSVKDGSRQGEKVRKIQMEMNGLNKNGYDGNWFERR